jgi:hypothetical protein
MAVIWRILETPPVAFEDCFSLESNPEMRIPTKPAMHSNLKPATYTDLKAATVPI